MLLLDTCTLLWLAADHTRLSEIAIDSLVRFSDETFVSAISAFEVGIKCHKGKLKLPMPPGRWYEAVLRFHGIREIPVSGEIASMSTELSRLHADPCDRIIVATAQQSKLSIVTPDPLIEAYPAATVVW